MAGSSLSQAAPIFAMQDPAAAGVDSAAAGAVVLGAASAPSPPGLPGAMHLLKKHECGVQHLWSGDSESHAAPRALMQVGAPAEDAAARLWVAVLLAWWVGSKMEEGWTQGQIVVVLVTTTVFVAVTLEIERRLAARRAVEMYMVAGGWNLVLVRY